jgi:F0F1-type ATP synthase assembly protein I
VEPDPSAPKKQKPSSDFLKYSSLGVQLLATIGAAAWLGYSLDQYLELKFPVFLLSLVLLSFAGTIFQLYRSISK